ncbi:unnamed protein product [Cylicostephanus goldi]|uniref:Uncharacterized protein n=1 Tax=Cylicostephanus goldi TaxID=71465 RepID=A0A3P6SLE4_CYLGO|nr:unnamed protein product [Cylicostephanus goldi]
MNVNLLTTFLNLLAIHMYLVLVVALCGGKKKPGKKEAKPKGEEKPTSAPSEPPKKVSSQRIPIQLSTCHLYSDNGLILSLGHVGVGHTLARKFQKAAKRQTKITSYAVSMFFLFTPGLPIV